MEIALCGLCLIYGQSSEISAERFFKLIFQIHK